MKQLAYLHYTKFDQMNVPRKIPALKSWNTSLLKSREILEIDFNKYFGMVEIIGDMNKDKEDIQKQASLKKLNFFVMSYHK